MRLKSFQARTMTEAMQMAREALGDDAVIISTREEDGGKSVSVTAAIDPSVYDDSPRDHTRDQIKEDRSEIPAPNFEIGRSPLRPVPDAPTENDGIASYAAENNAASPMDWLQYDDEQEDSAVAEEITEAMLKHGMPEDVMDNIVSCASVIGLENPVIALMAALEHLFYFSPMPQTQVEAKENQSLPLMLVGAPGAGKTLTAAKIATRAKMNGLSFAVITTDTVRAGGVEQLRAFTNVLKSNLIAIKSPSDLSAILSDMNGQYDQIIIDTPGINIFDRQDVNMIQDFIGQNDMDIHLVMAAGGDAIESGEIAKAFTKIGVRHLIPTRIDMARRLGGIISAAHHGSLGFSDASDTAKVAHGLYSVTPKILAQLLMPQAHSPSSQADENAAILRTGTRL